MADTVTRNTRQRVETYELLEQLAGTGGVYTSNRTIKNCLAEIGTEVTLPAVTARLQSLAALGHVTIDYLILDNGRTHRRITLLSRPTPPRALEPV